MTEDDDQAEGRRFLRGIITEALALIQRLAAGEDAAAMVRWARATDKNIILRYLAGLTVDEWVRQGRDPGLEIRRELASCQPDDPRWDGLMYLGAVTVDHEALGPCAGVAGRRGVEGSWG